jgi:hypothetical protein
MIVMVEPEQPNCREYATSSAEMDRRKTAFTALAISLFISVCVSSYDFILAEPEIALPGIAVLGTVLLIARSSFNRLFEDSTHTRVLISNGTLVRKTKKSDEKHHADEFESIRIKRTVKGLIREIRIGLTGATAFHINGIEDFEQFKDDLIDATEDDVVLSEVREPVDLDHPWFYPIFGTLVGVISTVSFRILMRMNLEDFRYLQIGVGVFLIFVGGVFLGKQPNKGRYGNKGRVADFILGVLMLCLGMYSII